LVAACFAPELGEWVRCPDWRDISRSIVLRRSKMDAWSAFFSADNRMTAASFRRASPNHAQGFAQL